MTAELEDDRIVTMTLEERLRRVMRAKKLSQHGWGVAAGLPGSYVGMLISRSRDRGDGGIGRTSADGIAKLAKTANVSEKWLATGEGEMETPSEDAELPLSKRAGWAEALAEAKRLRKRTLPEKYLDAASVWIAPDRALTPKLILGIAETLYETEETGEPDETEGARREIERRGSGTIRIVPPPPDSKTQG